MKALSVGLIKGNIDEVDQKVQMTWVQPRVLDLNQVRAVNFGLLYEFICVSGLLRLIFAWLITLQYIQSLQ